MVFSDEDVSNIGIILRDNTRPMKERFRALFTLRNLGGASSIKQISSAFGDPSALLKHELAYCLGQMGDKAAIPMLQKVLEDKSQEPMVRHEAGEALGAIGCPSVEKLLVKYSDDPVVEVAETCQLAVGRIRWLSSEEAKSGGTVDDTFTSIDPTPPTSICKTTDVERLEQDLTNEELPLFDRYRAMFALRNMANAEGALALTKGFKSKSALLRHEVGFVLGQMAQPEATSALAAVLKDESESAMVRHEVAEALGALGTAEASKLLQPFLEDKADVVRESCEVALDMVDYGAGEEFQYADGLAKV